MHIQWFPGHMTKALRMMEESVRLVDAVVYVLDSRAAYSSLNPAFDDVIGRRAVLYVLNKADLAAEEANAAWRRHFKGRGAACVVSDGTRADSARQIRAQLLSLMEEKLARQRERGINKSVRAMVVGIPNCGKSTLINSLCGAKRAVTGDKAGVTKGKQWVRAGENLELLDTPGTLCPAFENQIVARHLAYVGSINDDIVDLAELCLEFLTEGVMLWPQAIAERYGVTVAGAPLEIYEAICRARGFLLRGGDCDYERCARAVLDDFRKGRMGRISLEYPENEDV